MHSSRTVHFSWRQKPAVSVCVCVCWGWTEVSAVAHSPGIRARICLGAVATPHKTPPGECCPLPRATCLAFPMASPPPLPSSPPLPQSALLLILSPFSSSKHSQLHWHLFREAFPSHTLPTSLPLINRYHSARYFLHCSAKPRLIFSHVTVSLAHVSPVSSGTLLASVTSEHQSGP